MRELFLYCDESIGDGRFYSNFYGGILVESKHILEVTSRLTAKKIELNIFGELKWQKISEAYADKYIAFLSELFLLLRQGKLKIRIMFRQNNWTATGLTAEQIENEYFMLYYQFIKHAFGLTYSTGNQSGVSVRLYFDRLPDTKEKSAVFKGQLLGLNHSSRFSANKVHIRSDQIAEIDSKEHVTLQALDVVLGAIQFRLNDKHLDKPEGSWKRGKRTIAKERVYKFINRQIRSVFPNFNVGTNTSDRGDARNYWLDAYRHWSFVPRSREQNLQYVNKKAPRPLKESQAKLGRSRAEEPI
jgi:Protein of unknown function (DUF3800)